MSIRLLIAAGQEITRLGLKAFLTGTPIEVIAEADTGEKAVELTATCVPDMVLMVLPMPDRSGLSALTSIKQKLPNLPVVMIFNQDHSTRLSQAHSLGASGYLLKDIGPERLREAISAVAEGETLWTPTDKRRLTRASGTGSTSVDIEAPLTSREMEVLGGMTLGQTNAEIGKQLGISYETVKDHVQNILRKIAVVDRTQAAIWAVRNDLL